MCFECIGDGGNLMCLLLFLFVCDVMGFIWLLFFFFFATFVALVVHHHDHLHGLIFPFCLLHPLSCPLLSGFCHFLFPFLLLCVCVPPTPPSPSVITINHDPL